MQIIVPMVDCIAIRNTLLSNVKYLRTLDQIWVDEDTIAVGNNTVTARCRVMGREGRYLVKCYFRPKRNTAYIYGSAYMRKELGVYTMAGRIEYIDIVLTPWVEGLPLDTYIGNPTSDYKALSQAFDRLACRTLAADGAHGDIKPENIIVRPDGEMELIDFDGAWDLELNNQPAEELGTEEYRHPRRTPHYNSKLIDDFPIAIISTALAALAHDRETMERYIREDKTLFEPKDVITKSDKAMECALRIFEERGDAAHYRIAYSVRSHYLGIFELKEYLEYALRPAADSVSSDVELDHHYHLWGYRRGDEWVIPPLYDMGFEPRNGVCRVKLGERLIAIPIRDEE